THPPDSHIPTRNDASPAYVPRPQGNQCHRPLRLRPPARYDGITTMTCRAVPKTHLIDRIVKALRDAQSTGKPPPQPKARVKTHRKENSASRQSKATSKGPQTIETRIRNPS